MKKYFKHTKKLVLMVLTMIMVLATSVVVLAGTDSQKAPDPTNLTVFKVGTQKTNKDGSLKYDAYGNKDIKSASVVLYSNGIDAEGEEQFSVDLTGTEGGSKMAELYNFIELEVDARIRIDTDGDGKIGGKVDGYKNGYYTVKSSDESVAKVEAKTRTITLPDGTTRESQYIVITAGEKSGTATIKLSEQYPTNPKKPKTVSVKVTVKTLVDEINFDRSVVKEVDGVNTVTVGVKGSVNLGTTTNAASSSKVKYVIDKAYSKYFSVNGKGVLTAKNLTTDTLPEGYVEVRVVAQDQSYTYDVTNNKGKVSTKKVVWGTNETIKVYIEKPEVLSVKVVNATLTNTDKYVAGKAAQKYDTINLKTNVSSNEHTYTLQTIAYAGNLWNGEVKENALTYTSSSAKVATVDKNGVITAVGNGTAKITIMPADGVKLAGKEAVTLTVKVTTDVETITVPGTEISTFTGSAYTLKATTNAGVDKKAATLTYELVSAKAADGVTSFNVGKKEYATFEEQVIGTSGAKNIVKGKFRSDIEGEIEVKVSSVSNPSISRNVVITFENAVTSVKATVPSYDKTQVKAKNNTTLYVDRVTALGSEIDTCEITATVVEKFAGQTDDLSKLNVSSNNTNVAVVEKVDGKIVVTAVGKGSAKITLAANDGSKKSATVTIKVVQKVNDITVTNAGAEAGETVMYLAPNAKNVTAATFAATTNTDADNKKVAYSFVASDVLNAELAAGIVEAGDIDAAKAFTAKNNKITLSADGNAAVADYIEANGKILLGTLTVTALDGIAYDYEAANAVAHIPYSTSVKVYAVAADKYMTQEALDAAVAAATGGQGLTLAKGDKLPLGSAIELPADVTVRTLKYSVDKVGKNLATVDGKGVVSAKKASDIQYATVTVTAVSGPEKTDVVTSDIKVRVVNAFKDYSKELDTQINAVLKDNNYTWLGAKPTYKKNVLTLAISDITMSKEAADAEMRAKLENVMKVFKDAADIAVAGTNTDYKTLTIIDPSNGNVWYMDRIGTEVAVYENNGLVGTYGYDEVDAAISALIELITEDIDEIVEWANKNLVVYLDAVDSVSGFAPYAYTTQYTVAITIKDADVETFLDGKVAKAANAFAAANDKDQTGIDTVTYDANTNSTTVSIYNGNVVLKDAYELVKADAVAALEEIFQNADKAVVQVAAPEKTYETTYVRGENSDVNNLVDELYAKLCEELPEGAIIKNLEGTTVYATVDFNFSGKIYTKTYQVTFKRTVEAIDAETDAKLVELVGQIGANPFGTVNYDPATNSVNVLVNEFGATLEEAVSVVDDVEAFVNTMASDTFAKDVKIADVLYEDVTWANNKISATDVLSAIKPAWYAADAEKSVLARQLYELVNTEATVVVYYGDNQTIPVYYTVNFDMNMDVAESNVDAAIVENVNAINAVEITEETVILDADFSVPTNTAVVVINDAYLEAYPEELQGTGLYTMLADVLTAAKENCGVTVDVTVGKKAETVDLAKEINSQMVVDLVNDLGIKVVGDLTENTFDIVITFSNGETVSYEISFLAQNVTGTTPSLPIMPSSTSFEQEIRAGKELYYTGRFAEMQLTVVGEGAYIVYEGVTYEAVNGVATVVLGGNNWMWPAFAIGNASDSTVVYDVTFAYPLGHQQNPEVISDLSDYANYYDGNIEAGKESGYYYTYEATQAGSVTVWFAESTEGVEADIAITNYSTYASYTLLEDGVTDWSGTLLTVPVEAGDVLSIQVSRYPDADWNYPALKYSMAAIYEYPVGSEQNPADLGIYRVPATTVLEVPAGETVYYEGNPNLYGVTMTLTDASGSAVVAHQGATYKVEGEATTVEVPLTSAMPMRMPIYFSVENTSDVAKTYAVTFAYPVGSQSNPEVIETIDVYESYIDGSIAAGDEDGYYYTHTVANTGTISFYFGEATEGVEADILVNNETSYASNSLLSDGVEDWLGNKVLTVEVDEGDVLSIQVVNVPDANWEYPALDYSMTVYFTYPAGSEQNPLTLELNEVPGTVNVTVPAGQAVYYQSYAIGGTEMTISNATGCALLFNGEVYTTTGSAIEVSLPNPGRMATVFGLHNTSGTASTYTLSFAYPEGTVNNPETISVGTYSQSYAEGADCYYYQWTATANGSMTFDISATTSVGWQYAVNNETTYAYGDTHWSDDSTVVSSETITVSEGDVIVIMVGTYDPADMWANPAGTVDFTVSFEAAAETPAE
ncbi:MAG: hypothetical protein IJZ23_08910 [Roseburia sp.]|nr:hypothetical protein [Roseburia sp.]